VRGPALRVSVVRLSVVRLSVVRLSVVRLSVVRLSVVLGAIVLVAGCSPGAVTVATPTADPRADAVCAALQAALPATVLTGDRRTTDPVSTRTAAWGDDPTVTLTCGVTAPARASSSAELVQINDSVSWLPVPVDGGGFDLYPYDRSVWVRVHVPATDRNALDAATQLTPAVALTVPSN